MRRSCLIILSCLLFSGAAHAAPKELTEKELSALATRVDKADKLFKSDKYEEALLIYQEAYDLTEEPTMLFSIAQCYRNLEKHQEAASNYRGFLAKAPEDSELRPLAQQLLAEVESKLPTTSATEPEPTRKPSKALYLFAGAGAAGVSWAGFGIAALSAASGVKAEQNPQGDGDIAATLTQKSRRRALASDLSLVAALGLGAGGFVLSKKEKEKTTLLLGPSQVTISVEF